MNKKISLGAAVTLIIVAIALTISVTVIVAMRYFNLQISSVSQRQQMFEYITEIDKAVRQNYFGDINEETLRASLARGYIDGIQDEYAVYLTAPEYAKETERLSGKWTGLGLRAVEKNDGTVVIAAVDTNSAAEKAGIKKDDVLTQLDGKAIEELDFAQVASTLTNATKAKLTVTRGTESIAFEISSSTYTVNSVQSSLMGTTGYIRLTNIFTNTPAQFKDAIASLESQGATHFLFDLRGNTGGSLEAACEIIGYLLPRGTFAYKTLADGTNEDLSTTDTYEMTLPSVTLVNAQTQGEAELFAGVLQEFKKTTVVGVKTAGRGLVQKYYTISTDGAAIRYSYASLSLADKAVIHATGITPTVVVGLTNEQEDNFDFLTADKDPQIQAGLTILKGGAVVGTTLTTETTVPTTTTAATTSETSAAK